MDLQRKALFFIPRAREILENRRVNVSALAAHSATLKRAGAIRGEAAGRNAIKKIWDCVPTVYESATGFIQVANSFLTAPAFSKSDIVACIFKIRNFATVAAELGMDTAAIAHSSQVREQVVRAAMESYRISYRDASALFQACSKSNAKIEEFIVTNVRNDSRANVKLEEDAYVYRRENLVAAPRVGHPWAIGA